MRSSGLRRPFLIAAVSEALLVIGIAFIYGANTSIIPPVTYGPVLCQNPNILFGCTYSNMIYDGAYLVGLIFLIFAALGFLLALFLLGAGPIARNPPAEPVESRVGTR